MPLAPRYTWDQDAASITVQVTLPGSALKSADIYVSDVLVKVNAPPYVLLLDLEGTVDDTSVVAKRNASTHVLHITINKTDSKLWEGLTASGSKQELTARRLESMERKQQAEGTLAEKRKERKYQEEKQTLRAQMAVDDTNRQILSDLKADEKQREEEAMYQSFRELQIKKQLEAQQQEPAIANTQTLKSSKAASTHEKQRQKANPSATPPTKKRVTFASEKPTTKLAVPSKVSPPPQEDEVVELNPDGSFDIIPSVPSKTIWDEEADDASSSDHEIDDIDEDEEADNREHIKPPPILKTQTVVQPAKAEPKAATVVSVPPPRSSTQAEIQFTARVFPTPMRESKAAEEEDWLIKNRKHLNKHQGLRGVATGFDISESDPAWLKAKGDDFYRSRDYQSAVNAYTEAISTASDSQPDLLTSCLSNRAACHLQLALFEKCLDDCSKALTYLPDTPESASSASDGHSRVIREFRLKLKLLVRRGTALCRLGKYTEAKADYGVALTMDKQNASLQHDYYQLLQLERSQQDKERGDECFKLNKLDDAITHYNESLALHPQSIACLSNRAACFLRRHDLAKCVEDCTEALTLLQQQPKGSESGISIAFFAVGPPPGTTKRREWVVKTLVRRGMAHVAMEAFEKAESDYAAAVELDPANEALKNDLSRIKSQLKSKAASHAERSSRPASVAA